MSAFQEIGDALNTRLLAMPSVPPIAWENVESGYTEGQTWIRCFNLPNGNAPAGVGVDALNKYQGLYALNLLCPGNTGLTVSAPIVDQLLSWFKRGTKLTTSGGIIVTLERAEVSTAMMEKTWYVTPITIRYYAHVQNT